MCNGKIPDLNVLRGAINTIKEALFLMPATNSLP